jgi:hypothetical protein
VFLVHYKGGRGSPSSSFFNLIARPPYPSSERYYKKTLLHVLSPPIEGCSLYTSCLEKLSDKSKKALFWDLTNGYNGAKKPYPALSCYQEPRLRSPPAIYQTVSRRGLLGNSGPFDVKRSSPTRLKTSPGRADNSLVEGKEEIEWRK